MEHSVAVGIRSFLLSLTTPNKSCYDKLIKPVDVYSTPMSKNYAYYSPSSQNRAVLRTSNSEYFVVDGGMYVVQHLT